MTLRQDVRRSIIKYSHLVYQKGWVANHEGNLSVRIGRDRFLCTPTSFSKGDVGEKDLIIVDAKGQRQSGFRRPFSEFALHSAIYAARPDVNAVVHAHPPYSTAFAVAGRGLARPIIAESVVSLGPTVPLVPFALPGADESARHLADAFVCFDVCIAQNHGVFSAGDNLEQAFLRLEYCEHLSRVESHAIQIGGARYLTWNEIQPLLDKRRSAGLGPEARGMSRAEFQSRCGWTDNEQSSVGGLEERVFGEVMRRLVD
jgi:L-fuculose-phosphate aldolase